MCGNEDFEKSLNEMRLDKDRPAAASLWSEMLVHGELAQNNEGHRTRLHSHSSSQYPFGTRFSLFSSLPSSVPGVPLTGVSLPLLLFLPPSLLPSPLFLPGPSSSLSHWQPQPQQQQQQCAGAAAAAAPVAGGTERRNRWRQQRRRNLSSSNSSSNSRRRHIDATLAATTAAAAAAAVAAAPIAGIALSALIYDQTRDTALWFSTIFLR